MTGIDALKEALDSATTAGSVSRDSLRRILAADDSMEHHLGYIFCSLGNLPLEASGPDPTGEPPHPVASASGAPRYLTKDEEIFLAKAIEFTRRRIEWTAEHSKCPPEVRERYLSRIDRSPLPPGGSRNRLLTLSETDLESRWQEHLLYRNELVEANLALVERIALRYRTYGIPHADLAQHGNLGLIRAADKFDWRRNVRFRTYAEWWIRQAIERATDTDRDVIHVPRPMRQKISKANHLHRSLGTTRPMDAHRFAELMGIDRAAAARVLSIKSGIASLDRSGLEDGHPMKDDIEGPDLSGREEAENMEHLRTRLGDMLEELPEREQRVLCLRYGLGGEDPRTLEEVGQILHISRERVRQLQMRALDQLRDQARDPRVLAER